MEGEWFQICSVEAEMYCAFLRLMVVKMPKLMPRSGCRQYIWVMSFTKHSNLSLPVDPQMTNDLKLYTLRLSTTTNDVFSLTLHKIAIQTL